MESKQIETQLAALEGSENQIAWATKIRAEVIGRLETRRAALRRPLVQPASATLVAARIVELARIEGMIANLAPEPSAKWWVAGRVHFRARGYKAPVSYASIA